MSLGAVAGQVLVDEVRVVVRRVGVELLVHLDHERVVARGQVCRNRPGPAVRGPVRGGGRRDRIQIVDRRVGGRIGVSFIPKLVEIAARRVVGDRVGSNFPFSLLKGARAGDRVDGRGRPAPPTAGAAGNSRARPRSRTRASRGSSRPVSGPPTAQIASSIMTVA